MGPKTISVTEEVYNLLKKMRLPGESFGDTIARLCKNKMVSGLLLWSKTAKGWTDLTDEEEECLEDTLRKIRETLRLEGVEMN